MNYQEMDQSAWVCYQFNSNSYYYGQVGYLEEGGVVLSKDNLEAANNNKNRLVKHGFGIYIYDVNQNGESHRYQGHWDRDRKNGQGKLIVPHSYTYEGGFKDGSYHQHGKMQWANGDSYQGIWKKGKMQGGGIFKHHEGTVLKGSFKSNHFIDDNVLRNPQMSQSEYALFRKQRKEVIKQRERNEKIKHGFVLKLAVNQIEKLGSICQKSNKNKRIPLIIGSESSQINLNKIVTVLGGKCNIFDLRKADTLKGQQRFNYKKQFSQITKNTIKNGEILIINLDETDVHYDNHYYPDIKQFYQTNGFNINTWSRQMMQRKQVYQKLLGNGVQPSQNYQIIVWSKTKLTQELKEERIREKIQLKFESILPFIKIDIVHVISGEK